MPMMKVCAVDSIANKLHISGKTTRKVKVNRNQLDGIKTKSVKMKDMGGFDPQASADEKTTKKILGGMAGGAAAGAAIAGPIGALAGGLVGAVGGAIASLFNSDDSKK